MADKNIAETIAETIRALSERMSWWTRPLEQALPWRYRFLYASVGAGAWTAARYDQISTAVLATFYGAPTLVMMVLTCLVVGAWFGWLISYRERRCSPSRFFLEGIVFPAIAGSLMVSESPLRAFMEIIP